MNAEQAAELAIELLKPLAGPVADWLEGKTEKRPAVLALLPVELQDDAALKRLTARAE